MTNPPKAREFDERAVREAHDKFTHTHGLSFKSHQLASFIARWQFDQDSAAYTALLKENEELRAELQKTVGQRERWHDTTQKLLVVKEELIKERDEARAELEKTKYALEQTNNGRPSEWAYSILRKDRDAARAKLQVLREPILRYREHSRCECGQENCHECATDCMVRVALDEALAEVFGEGGVITSSDLHMINRLLADKAAATDNVLWKEYFHKLSQKVHGLVVELQQMEARGILSHAQIAVRLNMQEKNWPFAVASPPESGGEG